MKIDALQFAVLDCPEGLLIYAVKVNLIRPLPNDEGTTFNSPSVNICDVVVAGEDVNQVNNTDVIIFAANDEPVTGVTSIYPKFIPVVVVPSVPVNLASKYTFIP